jgi:hypothetical protein
MNKNHHNLPILSTEVFHELFQKKIELTPLFVKIGGQDAKVQVVMTNDSHTHYLCCRNISHVTIRLLNNNNE